MLIIYSGAFLRHKRDFDLMNRDIVMRLSYNEQFTLAELKAAPHCAKESRHGLDKIYSTFLKTLPETCLDLFGELLGLYNLEWRKQSSPDIWKHFYNIPIRNLGKDTIQILRLIDQFP